MKKSERRIIIVLFLIILFMVGVIYIAIKPKQQRSDETENKKVEEFVVVQEDGAKINTSHKLKEEKMLDGLKIANIRLTEQEGETRLLADITNTTANDVEEGFFIDIILYNYEGKEIETITGLVTPIKAGSTKRLSAAITEDYANAYNFKVQKSNEGER